MLHKFETFTKGAAVVDNGYPLLAVIDNSGIFAGKQKRSIQPFTRRGIEALRTTCVFKFYTIKVVPKGEGTNSDSSRHLCRHEDA